MNGAETPERQFRKNKYLKPTPYTVQETHFTGIKEVEYLKFKSEKNQNL